MCGIKGIQSIHSKSLQYQLPDHSRKIYFFLHSRKNYFFCINFLMFRYFIQNVYCFIFIVSGLQIVNIFYTWHILFYHLQTLQSSFLALKKHDQNYRLILQIKPTTFIQYTIPISGNSVINKVSEQILDSYYHADSTLN